MGEPVNAAPQLCFAFGKRWSDRAQRWVAPGRTFSAHRFGVDVLPERVAKAFVIQHHYSGTFPAARLCVGLMHARPCGTDELVGVAVFSVGVQPRAIPRYTGLAAPLGVELGRFVLLDDVAYNGETWFLARALRALRAEKPDVRAVVSYADPLERRDPVTDAIVKRAHWGTIYRAGNATFAGRAASRTLLLGRDGRIVAPRAIAKIRNGERGHEYARAQLLAAGASPQEKSEMPAAWVERVSSDGSLQRIAHPGNLVFAFGLDADARESIARAVA